MEKEVIRGMLLVLNKLYWKVPANISDFIVIESNNISGLGGYFKFEEGMVVFKEKKRKKNS